MALFLCFLFFLASSASACDRCVHETKVSYFSSASSLSSGACGYGSLALGFNRGHTAAAVPSLYKDGAGCGACFQIRCKNKRLCSKQGTKVIVTDLNKNNQTDFVLSSRALMAMANKGMGPDLLKLGLVNVEYKRVPCEYKNQNLAVRVEETSQKPNYLAVKFLYQGGQTEIVAVDVAQVGSPNWSFMSRKYGAIWDTSRVPTGPLQFRLVVTSGYDGKWIWAQKVDILWRRHYLSHHLQYQPLFVRMNADLTPIANITSSTRNWKAQVRVLEKWQPRKAHSSPLRYQKFILGDTQGTQVQATIFDAQIEKFEDTLQILKSYHISNASVKFVEKKHRIVNHPWQWIINASTLIQPLDNDPEDPNLPSYNFVHFSDFHNHVDLQSQIDVLAAVVEIRRPKIVTTQTGTSNAQEIIVVDQQFLPTLMTLWDHFVTNEGVALTQMQDSFPTLIGIRLKVTSYGGTSLSTRPTSSFVLNPTSTVAHVLRTWCIENEDKIRARTFPGQDQLSIIQAPTPKEDKIVQIQNLPIDPDLPRDKIYWIKAKMLIASLDQQFWYMGCSNCFKSINANYQTIFDCFQCKEKKVTAQPRVKFDVELSDTSGSMIATLFEDYAKKLFSLTGSQLMEHTTEDGKVSPEAFSNLSVDKYHIIQLKARQYHFRGTSKLQFIITSVNDEATNNMNEAPIETAPLQKLDSDPKAKRELFIAATSAESTSLDDDVSNVAP